MFASSSLPRNAHRACASFLIVMGCAGAWCAPKVPPIGCQIQIIKIGAAVTVEKAPEPAPGTEPAWSAIAPGESLMTPHQFRFPGGAVLKMTAGTLEWMSDPPAEIEVLGKAGMMINLGQKVNLFLERPAKKFTHSAAITVKKAEAEGFYATRIGITPINMNTAGGGVKPANADSPSAKEYTLNLDTWSCQVEKEDDGGLLMLFVRLIPQKTACS